MPFVSVLDAAGVNVDRRTTQPEYKLGTIVTGDDGNTWIYVVATENVATGVRTVNSSTYALTSAAGGHTADTAFANGEYGWVRKTTKALF